MPYRNAPYAMIAVIAVILQGFWPSYFGVWTEARWQFHAHGIAASLWVLMVLAQSILVHKSQLPLHRAVGKASLILFPFLIGGLAAIMDVAAKGFVSQNDPTRVIFGAQFFIGTALAMAAYVTLFYRSLAYRRKVWVHAGYMLSTPLILFESPFSRVLGMTVPIFAVKGPADFPKIIASIETGMALELVIIALLWWRYRDKARPFLVAGGFIVAQMLTMGLLQGNAVLEAVLRVVGGLPSAVMVLTGMTIGAATSWLGWEAGKRPVPSGVRAPA